MLKQKQGFDTDKIKVGNAYKFKINDLEANVLIVRAKNDLITLTTVIRKDETDFLKRYILKNKDYNGIGDIMKEAMFSRAKKGLGFKKFEEYYNSDEKIENDLYMMTQGDIYCFKINIENFINDKIKLIELT
jgi:hypothetical protein